MQGRTVRSTRLHQRRDRRPRLHPRLQTPPRRHRRGPPKRHQQGRTARRQQGHRLSKLRPSLHPQQLSAIRFTGFVEPVEKSMDCTVMVATRAVHPSMLRGMFTSTALIGSVHIVRTKYPLDVPSVTVESGGQGAHRSLTTARLLKIALSPKAPQQHGWCLTGGK